MFSISEVWILTTRVCLPILSTIFVHLVLFLPMGPDGHSLSCSARNFSSHALLNMGKRPSYTVQYFIYLLLFIYVKNLTSYWIILNGASRTITILNPSRGNISCLQPPTYPANRWMRNSALFVIGLVGMGLANFFLPEISNEYRYIGFCSFCRFLTIPHLGWMD